MNTIDTLGWLGAVAFAVCAIPQAYKSWKGGHSDGISWGFLGLWTFGEICTLIYTIPKGLVPLIFNYLGNLLFLAVIIKYKVRPRK